MTEREKGTMINKELELIKDIGLIAEKKIVIFGAAGLGRMVKHYLELVGLEIECFCDNDRNKWGNDLEGVSVFSPQQLECWHHKNEMIIIVASTYIHEIIHQLENSDLKNTPIYSYVALEYSVLFCSQYRNISIESKMFIEGGYQLWLTDQRKVVADFNASAKLNELNRLNPVLVFHPGKVGSSSVHHSLVKSGVRSFQLCDLFFNIHCTDNSDIKKSLFNLYKKNNNIKIISLVREPVARDLSLYLQSTFTDPEWHIKGRVSNDLLLECKKYMLDYTIGRGADADVVCDWLDYLALHGKNGVEFDWFDYEVKQLFGIDIYAEPFDRERGYCIIKKENIEILVIKMEYLNQLNDVIGDFVGFHNFVLNNDNVGSNKEYCYIYKELKEKIRFPREYLDFYYKDNIYFNYFYSEKERKEFWRNWEKHIK